jgi:hypothetical protein
MRDAIVKLSKWSGRVLATSEYLVALEEYVRSSLLEGEFSETADGGASRVVSRVSAAREEFRQAAVAAYCAIESSLPGTFQELTETESQLIASWTMAATRFAVDIEAIDLRLLPTWSGRRG